MDYLLDIVDPLELTGLVREIDPAQWDYTLDRWFPVRHHQNTEFEFDVVDETQPEMAKFRPWDVESDIAKREGFTRKRGAVPPISRKIPVMEEERLRLHALRTNAGQKSREIIEQIYADARNLTRAVHARLEYARGQILTNGKLSFAGYDRENLFGDVDFGIPADLKANAQASWATTNTDILSHELAWVETYKSYNAGRPPRYALVSSKTRGRILRNEKVREQVFRAIGTPPDILTMPQLNALREVLELPQLVVYDATVNIAGSTVRVIDEDRIVYLPEPSADDFAETYMGITAEALDLVGSGLVQFEPSELPGLVALNYKTKDPVHTWTQVAAVGMPILKNPARVMTINTVPSV